jgi:putative oxidoreductase
MQLRNGEFRERSSAAPATLIDTSPYAPYVLSIARIVIALLFFEHGLSKLYGFPQDSVKTLLTLGWFSGVIEFAGGALLTIGLWSRFAAFIMSGEMAFGYFMSHAPRGFFPMLNGGDAAILYCFIFLYFAFAGPGPWSIDALIQRRRLGAAQDQS